MEARPPLDVLICGAGAAGLTLAIDLARRGVGIRLIDKLPAPFAGSRGKAIQPRTQEVFEDLGVIDGIQAVGGPYPLQRRYSIAGDTADANDMAATAPTAEEPYGAPLMVPQFQTEEVLRARLAELGAAPEYGRELIAFEQDADGVVAQVGAAAGTETIRCRYLVGGDGGRSFIRHGLNLEFPGKTLGVRAIVADLRLEGLTGDVWHRFNEGDMARQLSFCPLPHTELFQLQAPIALDGDFDLSPAGLQAFVDERLPDRAIKIQAVSWASAYGMNARLADRYRVGRVLLIGDAAHIHPPTGGQGLNTSVQDAYNLGWKLAAVLAGAPEALLETYEEERRPIAAGMLGLATGLLDKMRQGDMRRGREVHQMDLGYGWSSLSLQAATRTAGLFAGERAPDGVLQDRDGRTHRLFDLYKGPHWTLLARGVDPSLLPHATPALHVVQIGSGGHFGDVAGRFTAVYGLTAGEVLLVRPDGYAGAIIDASDQAVLERYLAWVGLA